MLRAAGAALRWQGWGCGQWGRSRGILTHLTAAWKEVGAAIWREDLVCRLSNMAGANLGRRLAEQGASAPGRRDLQGQHSAVPFLIQQCQGPCPTLPTFHHPPPHCCHLGWGEDVFHFR